MVAAQSAHHGAAACSGRTDGAAHGVPYGHEARRAGSVCADPLNRRTARSQRGEIVADAAALLHGERGLADILEDGAEIILDPAHDEAVEQRHLPRGAGP